MSAESWQIILSESYSGPGGTAATSSSTTQAKSDKNLEAMAQQQKANAPAWANIGKLVAGLAGIAGVIAFVFQMIRRSKIFSTFMDSFLTVLSAFVEILMIPLIPVFSWVLKFLVKLLPLALDLQQKISDFLKDPVKGIRDLFTGIGNGIDNIFNFISNLFKGGIGDFLKELGFGNIGQTLGTMFQGIGKDLQTAWTQLGNVNADALQKIINIWGDAGLSTWDKIKDTAGVVWDAIKSDAKVLWDTVVTIWKNDIAPAIKTIWSDDIYPWIKDKATNVWDAIKNWWNDNVANPVAKNFEYLFGSGGYVSQLWQWLMTNIGTTWQTVVHNMEFALLLVLAPIAAAVQTLRGQGWQSIPAWTAAPNLNMPGFSSQTATTPTIPGSTTSTKVTTNNVTVNVVSPVVNDQGTYLASTGLADKIANGVQDALLQTGG